MDKNPIKSKTMLSGLVILIIALMSLAGVGEKQLGETFDTMTDVTRTQIDNGKEIIQLLGCFGVFYGRYKVKGGKDE